MTTRIKFGKVFSIFLLVIIALALTPSISSSTVDAKYGNGHIQTNLVDPSADNRTVLTYGNVRNLSAYITVRLNGTEITQSGALNYTVSYLGTYSVGGNVTLAGLDNSKVYNVYVEYDYLVPVMLVSLLSLAPLMWIVLIVGITVAYVVLHFRGIRG